MDPRIFYLVAHSIVGTDGSVKINNYGNPDKWFAAYLIERDVDRTNVDLINGIKLEIADLINNLPSSRASKIYLTDYKHWEEQSPEEVVSVIGGGVSDAFRYSSPFNPGVDIVDTIQRSIVTPYGVDFLLTRQSTPDEQRRFLVAAKNRA